MSQYPEHVKLKALKHKTEIVHEFLEWCQEQNPKLELMYFKDGDRDAFQLGIQETDQLLANFIGIDLKKIEEEKVQMLNEMRAMNAAPGGKQ